MTEIPVTAAETMDHFRSLIREHPDFRGLGQGGEIRFVEHPTKFTTTLEVRFHKWGSDIFRIDSDERGNRLIGGNLVSIMLHEVSGESVDFPLMRVTGEEDLTLTMDVGFTFDKEATSKLETSRRETMNSATAPNLTLVGDETPPTEPKAKTSTRRGRPRKDRQENPLTDAQDRMVKNFNKSSKDGIKVYKMGKDEGYQDPMGETHRILQEGAEIGRMCKRSDDEMWFSPVWRRTRRKASQTVKDGVAFLLETQAEVGADAEKRPWPDLQTG